MTDYREGNETEEETEQEVPTTDEVMKRRLEKLAEDSAERAKDPMPPDAEEEEGSEQVNIPPGKEVETAVLLIRFADGEIGLEPELDGIEMDHKATPIEQYQLVTEIAESGRVARIAASVEAQMLPKLAQILQQAMRNAVAQPPPKGGFRGPKRGKR